MKKRPIQLANGQNMTINDNEWHAVVDRKEFDDQNTEILRITTHNSGLMSRVFVLRAVGGKAVVQSNEIVVSDNLKDVATKAIADAGFTRITANDINI